MELPQELLEERYCVLATQARMGGRRHSAELWYLPAEGGVWLMSDSGGLTQWCLNLQAEEQGVVRIGGRSWLARASFLHRDDPERHGILAAFHERYDPPGKDRTSGWVRDATVVHMVFVRELDRS
jgi:hypothetical protein